MAALTHDLAVRGESIQHLYNLYVLDRFQVNRRYQRKLVWTVEEKQKLIDSIQRDLPLPLVLVAELSSSREGALELIDGLQRMNAIFSFLENEYPLSGKYFDLDALADTKERKDEGILIQKTPIMSRADSSAIANYTIALSVFRAPDQASIEEIFRRINSGGRRLSRQALRQAGTISPLADLVRVISSRIRGDTSPGDSVPLRQMPQLSVTNYNLDYGVRVDDIFWVRNLILRREDIRESLDEQLILDLLIDCLIDPIPRSGTRSRDAYYDYNDSEDGPTKESASINGAIDASDSEQIVSTFMKVYDEVRNTISASGSKFANLVGVGSGGRSPRYFHGVFIAVYELIVRDHLRIRDYNVLAANLSGISSSALSVPGGGGDWTGAAKRKVVDGVKGVLKSAFEGPVRGDDLGHFGYASHLETLLSNSLVEQQLFDHKQGLLKLDKRRGFDERCLKRIAQTLAGMHNMGPGSTGYVVLGIADDEDDFNRIVSIDAIPGVRYRGFRIVGIDREAHALGIELNNYWYKIIQKLRSCGLESNVADSVCAHSRLIPYQGLAVGMIEVFASDKPTFIDNKLYERSGSETVCVAQDQYMRVFSRFSAPKDAMN